MKAMKLVTLALLSLASAACTANTSPEAAEPNASAVRAAEPAPDLTGTYVFVLEASEVAGPIRARCAEKAAGDTTKQAACWDEIAAEAKTEKIRFAKTTTGAVWSSFGDRDGLYLAVPVELAADGPGHVLAKITGAATGPHAPHFQNASINQMRIEILDAGRIAMNDPMKGRLVYEKTP